MARGLAASLFADALVIAEATATRWGHGGDGGTPAPDPFERAEATEEAALHLQHLAAALRLGERRWFDDHVLTAAGLAESIGAGRPELQARLAVLLDVIEHRHGTTARSVAASVVDGSLERLDGAELRSVSYLADEGPSSELAHRALDALLDGDPRTAVAMLLESEVAHEDVSRLYLEILTPCLREVGRLWQLGRASVAQEHLVTAAMQLVMAHLSPRIYGTPRGGQEVVVSTVAGELHAVGARMVADHFELAGWDTYFLGADLPTGDVVRLVEKVEPDVVVVSATLPSNVLEVAAVVEALRAARPVVLVGGRPFDLVPDLWQVVGADGPASDAAAAVRQATALVGDSR